MKSSQIPPSVEYLEIGLASPEKIRQWAEKILPNGNIIGKVTCKETIKYSTLKPIKDGLFCERIFGPVEDFICSCGKKADKNQRYCDECDVEYTSSKVRRYRLGYIALESPVAHVWYFKGKVNYISLLTGFKKKTIEAFLYGTRVTHSIESFAFFNKLKLQSQFFAFFVLPARLLSTWKNEKDAKDFLSFFAVSEAPGDFLLPEYFPLTLTKEKFNLTAGREAPRVNLNQHAEPARGVVKAIGSFQVGQKNRKTISRKFFSLKHVSSKKKSLTDRIFMQKNSIKNKRKCFDSFEPTLPQPQKEVTRDLSVLRAYKPEKKMGHKIDKLSCMGAGPLQTILSNLDFSFLDCILEKKLYNIQKDIGIWFNKSLVIPEDIKTFNQLKASRLLLLKRIKLGKHFLRTNQKPEWMILSVLPVIPPGLRPIVPIGDGPCAISGLNNLYKNIIIRNRRFTNKSFDNLLFSQKQKLLQEGVDALIENGKGGAKPITDGINGQPLKSLSDMLKGKTGRFRQNLLGKRVDYSGRSVIVVGPQLKIHECGLPKEMALVLFQPFLIRKLIDHGLATTIGGAKRLIAGQSSVLWEVLEQLLDDHLVLLNRAPTLHRLGIQAFQPRLVNGRAILLNPLVCSGFNADFDGDQMAVHIPLSFQARAEAWQLMWSRNNILSPATGQPVLLPSQDMVLGCYYLTTENKRKQRVEKPFCFSDVKETLVAYAKNKLDLHAFLWVRCNSSFETANKENNPVEIQIDSYGNSFELYENAQYFFDYKGHKVSQKIRTTLGRIIFNQIIQNCFEFF